VSSVRPSNRCEGFLYLAFILDACTRRVVSWAMADHVRRELVLDAVGMARPCTSANPQRI
jgi:transposase InsO family protein